MFKKLSITLSIIFSIILVLSQYCFANDASNMVKDAKNDIQNAASETKNDIQNAASETKKDIKNTADDISNDSKAMTNDIKKGAQDTTTKMKDSARNTVDGVYNATRTSTNPNNPRFMGMSTTMWTWVIMMVAGIAIIALVWYYSSINTKIK